MKKISVLFALLIYLLISGCSDEISQPGITDESLNKPGNPPVVQSLLLLNPGKQIAGSHKQLEIWTYSGGNYLKTWTKTASGTFFADIADIDNDGKDELVAFFKGEKKSAGILELQIYENGSTGTPSIVSGNLAALGLTLINYMCVSDANGDGIKEIILAGPKYISVHQVTGNTISMLWKSEYLYSDYPFGVDVGDADNDGSPDIVFAALFSERFGVYKYLGNNVWGEKKYSPVYGGQDRVFIADTDGDTQNEIVTGGSYSKAAVWKFNGTDYELKFESQNLGGFTQGITAGDFDADGKTEIGAANVAGEFNNLVVFKFINDNYAQVYSTSLIQGAANMASGDLDNDGKDEIVIGSFNLEIFKYNGTGYGRIFTAPGSGFVKVD